MSLVVKQDDFLHDVVALLQHAWALGFSVTGGELSRTKEQQGIYYAWGRTKTMNSKHLQRLAIDLNFFIGGQLITAKTSLQVLGDFWESLNEDNRWGGNWTWYDGGHFERG